MKTPWVVAFAFSTLAVAATALLFDLLEITDIAVAYFSSSASDLRLYYSVFYMLLIALTTLGASLTPTSTNAWIRPIIGSVGGGLAGILSVLFLIWQESGFRVLASHLERFSWDYLAALFIGVLFPLLAWAHGAVALSAACISRDLYLKRNGLHDG